MSRDRFDDIPEAFRRAFEDSNWGRGGDDNGGNGGDGGNGRPPFPPRQSDGRSLWQNRSLWILQRQEANGYQ